MYNTLAINSSFQTFTMVGLLVKFIDYVAVPVLSPETLSSLSKWRISLFNAHLALFVRRMTQLQSNNSIVSFSKLTLDLA